ncbi:MAG TPA: flagellar biosynthetic protein FliQ [Parvularcula sp.]|nr:flagellar biosynthetic protein FliQ [Parvularcula sp.]HBS30973.1 flagellar biosynthetic protein FliQ [Parvularcula sp.]HBS34974.1 flagellar biosynthetic protein FliQ [Parvularcula sp.]
MTEQDVLGLLREALSLSVVMVAPLMFVALSAGLVIGLLQALTSVQEQTLTFAPKLAAMLIVFAVTAGSTGRMLADFFETRLIPLIAGG